MSLGGLGGDSATTRARRSGGSSPALGRHRLPVGVALAPLRVMPRRHLDVGVPRAGARSSRAARRARAARRRRCPEGPSAIGARSRRVAGSRASPACGSCRGRSRGGRAGPGRAGTGPCRARPLSRALTSSIRSSQPWVSGYHSALLESSRSSRSRSTEVRRTDSNSGLPTGPAEPAQPLANATAATSAQRLKQAARVSDQGVA